MAQAMAPDDRLKQLKEENERRRKCVCLFLSSLMVPLSCHLDAKNNTGHGLWLACRKFEDLEKAKRDAEELKVSVQLANVSCKPVAHTRA